MILLRHGQSAFNLYYNRTGQDPGLCDPPLTSLGWVQAEAAAERLAAAPIRRILVSPYRRALQTAFPLARRLGLPLTVTPLVRERFAFSCDIGSRRSVLAREFPDLDFTHLEEVWWPPQEEPAAAVAARVRRFWAEMAALPDADKTVVVSHWGFIFALSGRSLDNGEMLRLLAWPRGETALSSAGEEETPF